MRWQRSIVLELSVSDEDRNHPLRRTLAATQERLQSALEEMCDDVAIAETPTQELIRIEETLALASDAAKQAISLRQRLDIDESEEPPIA